MRERESVLISHLLHPQLSGQIKLPTFQPFHSEPKQQLCFLMAWETIL